MRRVDASISNGTDGARPRRTFDDLGDEFADIERLEQPRILAFELREQHEVVDERAHAPPFGGDRREDEVRAVVGGARAPAQQVDVAQDDRQRRAQFVAGVGDELPDLRLGGFAFGERRRDLLRRRVVRVREHVEIALARERDRLRPEVARGKALQRLRHVDQRLDRLLRDVAADEERQQSDGDRRAEHRRDDDERDVLEQIRDPDRTRSTPLRNGCGGGPRTPNTVAMP